MNFMHRTDLAATLLRCADEVTLKNEIPDFFPSVYNKAFAGETSELFSVSLDQHKRVKDAAERNGFQTRVVEDTGDEETVVIEISWDTRNF